MSNTRGRARKAFKASPRMQESGTAHPHPTHTVAAAGHRHSHTHTNGQKPRNSPETNAGAGGAEKFRLFLVFSLRSCLHAPASYPTARPLAHEHDVRRTVHHRIGI
eukprot:5132959-Prymnesium_polylepis.1